MYYGFSVGDMVSAMAIEERVGLVAWNTLN